ncbi:MAG TPA: DUF455 family protein [Deltaproteobacteria bacterium]|nr:DUF455 family protein [Deltaproteobacteria bacterium]
MKHVPVFAPNLPECPTLVDPMSCRRSHAEHPSGTARASTPGTVRDFCLQALERGDLATKLRPPGPREMPRLRDPEGVAATFIDAPARAPGLRMRGGSDRLPRPGELSEPGNRRKCLARFAHHELMAVELFAWALLRWPDLPRALRRGWLSALIDEQRHCRLYLERLRAHGGDFETDDHSDYFWRQAPAIAASPAGARAFLAAMGLTLEQANLDFTLTYRDGFAAAGDEETARVCQRVHDEEIAHVALAAHWIRRLESEDGDIAQPDGTDLDRYLACVPFPLGPARAKGRRFEVSARRRAGLSDRFIETVRRARSPQEQRRGQAPSSSPMRVEALEPPPTAEKPALNDTGSREGRTGST